MSGGYPAFPNLHGTGADGVKSFEIVLADSTIITPSAETNKELYRALKGGGSNFGIVTQFDIAVYPLIKVNFAISLYSPSDYANILKATVQVQEAMETDSKLSLFTNFNANFVAVGLLHADSDSPDERPKAFDPFCNLSSLMTTLAPPTNGTILGLANAMAHPTLPAKRTIGSVTTRISYDLYVELYKSWADIVNTLPTGVVLHYTIQPVSGADVQAGEDRGENIMGLEKATQCWWVFTAEWPQDGDDAAARAAVDAIVHSVRGLARQKGLLLEYITMNFANSSQDVLRSYGADNVRRMQQVAAKYDPSGVFQTLQNDGFLLRKL